jgi:hypothetical protein
MPCIRRCTVPPISEADCLVVTPQAVLDAAMARAHAESTRWMDDLKSGGPLKGPYRVIVDFVTECTVTRDSVVDVLM